MKPVFRIRNVLVRIRILGSVPPKYRSGSFSFLQWQKTQSFLSKFCFAYYHVPVPTVPTFFYLRLKVFLLYFKELEIGVTITYTVPVQYVQ